MSNINDKIQELINALDENKKIVEEAKKTARKLEKEDKEIREKLSKAINGVETSTNNNNANTNTNNKKNNKKLVKGIKITVAGILILGGLHHLCKDALDIRFVRETKSNKKQEQSIDIEENEEKFNREVVEYMKANPTVSEDAARAYIAIAKQDELIQTNPELLYNITGIYDYQEITEEAFEELVTQCYMDLRNADINVSLADVRKLVAVINNDQIATDNPELLNKLLGDEKPEEFLTDVFKVTGAIKNRNYAIFAKEKSTENLIKLSNYVYDKRAKEDLLLIESYVDKSVELYGEKAEQNNIVEELMNLINNADGALNDMESGIGFASTVAFDELINYTTRNENYMLLTKENNDLLLVHNTLEKYLSGVLSNINNSCIDAKKRTR